MRQRYRAKFIGRKRDAIGVTFWNEIILTAADKDHARLRLYETHEHITGLTLELLTPLSVRDDYTFCCALCAELDWESHDFAPIRDGDTPPDRCEVCDDRWASRRDAR